MLCLNLGLTKSEDSTLGETYSDLGAILTALMKSFWDSSKHTATHSIKYVKLLCSFKRFY